MDKDQIEKLFMKIDANSDGSVDWEEFSNYIMSRTFHSHDKDSEVYFK